MITNSGTRTTESISGIESDLIDLEPRLVTNFKIHCVYGHQVAIVNL